MPTKSPIVLTDAAWVEISAGPCAVQVLSGQAWVWHVSAAPTPPPNAAVMVGNFEFDGHIIGHGRIPTKNGFVGIEHSYIGYQGPEKTYARARNSDGAVLAVTEQ